MALLVVGEVPGPGLSAVAGSAVYWNGSPPAAGCKTPPVSCYTHQVYSGSWE